VARLPLCPAVADRSRRWWWQMGSHSSATHSVRRSSPCWRSPGAEAPAPRCALCHQVPW